MYLECPVPPTPLATVNVPHIKQNIWIERRIHGVTARTNELQNETDNHGKTTFNNLSTLSISNREIGRAGIHDTKQILPSVTGERQHVCRRALVCAIAKG